MHSSERFKDNFVRGCGASSPLPLEWAPTVLQPPPQPVTSDVLLEVLVTMPPLTICYSRRTNPLRKNNGQERRLIIGAASAEVKFTLL